MIHGFIRTWATLLNKLTFWVELNFLELVLESTLNLVIVGFICVVNSRLAVGSGEAESQCKVQI